MWRCLLRATKGHHSNRSSASGKFCRNFWSGCSKQIADDNHLYAASPGSAATRPLAASSPAIQRGAHLENRARRGRDCAILLAGHGAPPNERTSPTRPMRSGASSITSERIAYLVSRESFLLKEADRQCGARVARCQRTVFVGKTVYRAAIATA